MTASFLNEGIAQSNIPDLRFKTLTQEQGLNDNRNAFVSKDAHGFTWISSMDGLYRFDGVTLKPYRIEPGDDARIRNNIVTSPVFEDAAGNLWFSVYSGIQHFNRSTNKFDFYQVKPDSTDQDYYTFYLDPDQNLWTCAGRNKISNLYLHNIITGKDSVLIENFQIRRCAFVTNEKGYITRLVGCHMGRPGVEIVDFTGPGKKPVRRSFLNHPGGPRIRGQLIINDTLVWLGGESGLIRLNPVTGQHAITESHNGHTFGAVWSFAPVPGSHLAFMSTGRAGIKVIDTRNGQILGDYRHQAGNSFSLARDSINELYLDPEDNLWVSLYSFGLNYANLRKVKFQTQLGSRKPDGQYVAVNAVACDSKGTIWAIADGALYTIKPNGSPEAWPAAPGNPGYKPRSIYADKNREIWLLQSNRVFKLDRVSGQFNPIAEFPENPELIYHLAEGGFLLATDNDLYFLLENGSYEKVTLDDQASVTEITAVFQDRSGKLFLSQNGADLIIAEQVAPGRLKTFKFFKDIGYCYSIYDQPDSDNLLLATWRGIARISKKDTLYSLLTEKKGGIPTGIYYHMLPDAQNRLWISGSRGLFLYNPANQFFHPFTLEDGILQAGYSANAAAVLPDGRFVFGGKGGLNIFYPDNLNMIEHLPKLQITGIEINENPLETLPDFQANQVWSLRHDENTIEIHFAGLEFSDPSAIRYKYRIKEIETDWVDGGHSGYARYPDLNPGWYTFEALASNSDGVWPDEKNAFRLSIYIRPAFYQRKLVRIAGLLVLFVIGALIYRRYAKQKLEARKEKELQEFKTQFFANITHDFRTPLTLIKSPLADALQKDADLDKKNIRMVMQNVARLEKYVNQVLDLNKLEAGQLTPQYGRGDLVLFLNDYVNGFQPVAVHRKIDLTFQPAFRALDMDLAPEFLDHIVGNLLSNAMKFTPPGGHVAVSLEEYPKSPDEKWVRIKVVDSGQGIPPENLEKIFDRFFQDKSKTSRGSGTGIGLHFTRQLIDLLGGSIHATNRQEGGAQFVFDLPVKKSDALPEVKPAFESLPPPPGLSGEKNAPVVLIVEDDAPMANYIRQVLAGRYDCQVASDGVEGWGKALELLPDLIISDVMMPRLDGLELLQRLREQEDTLSIPIIILTAKSSIETRLNALQSAADAYLPKPFNPAELLAQTDNLIRQRQRLKAYYKKLVSGETPGERPPNRLQKDEHFLEKISGYIQSRLMENFSVEDIAQYMLISPSSLYSKCKSLLGYAPKELIEQIRIKEAKRLLDTTDHPVNEISISVGYSASNYFIKVFRKYTNQTPAQYRKRGDFSRKL